VLQLLGLLSSYVVEEDTVLRVAGWRCSSCRHETGVVAYRRLGHVPVVTQMMVSVPGCVGLMGLMSVAMGCSARGITSLVMYAGSRLVEPRSTVAAVRTAASRPGLIPDPAYTISCWSEPTGWTPHSSLCQGNSEYGICQTSCFNSLLQAGRPVPNVSRRSEKNKINRLQRRNVSDCASNDDGSLSRGVEKRGTVP